MSVTISGTAYEVYGSIADLATYAGGSILWQSTYAGITADNRARALVEATRLLDRQRWQGAKVDDGQALAWPRTGVTVDGAEVSSASVPADITTAAYELAIAAMADASVIAGTSTGNKVSSVSAKGVGVTFFAPVTGSRFPDRVMELIGAYLGGSSDSSGFGASGSAGSYSSGTDGASAFDDCDTYSLTGPQ